MGINGNKSIILSTPGVCQIVQLEFYHFYNLVILNSINRFREICIVIDFLTLNSFKVEFLRICLFPNQLSNLKYVYRFYLQLLKKKINYSFKYKMINELNSRTKLLFCLSCFRYKCFSIFCEFNLPPPFIHPSHFSNSIHSGLSFFNLNPWSSFLPRA